VQISSWVLLGGLLAGLAVAAGAIGAHALDYRFDVQYAGRMYDTKGPDGSVLKSVPMGQKRLGDFKTGAEYQMSHALAIIAAGLGASIRPGRGWHIAATLFLLGIAGFSGGLYGLSIGDLPLLGATIVPLGGVLFLLGWTVFALTAWTMRRPSLSHP
jgi:uncharacterized membrane protein YgdD (TMEM256/DUF423 family)